MHYRTLKNITLFTACFALSSFLSMSASAADNSSVYHCRNYIGEDAIHSIYQAPYISFVEDHDIDDYDDDDQNIEDDAIYWGYDPGHAIRIGDNIYISVFAKDTYIGENTRYRTTGNYGLYQYNISTKKTKRISPIALEGMTYYKGYLYGVKASNRVTIGPSSNGTICTRSNGNNYIHFDRFDQKQRMYRINLESGKAKVICNVDYLYYKNKTDDTIVYGYQGAVYRMNLDGSGKKLLAQDTMPAFLRDGEYSGAIGITPSNKLVWGEKDHNNYIKFYTIDIATRQKKLIKAPAIKINNIFNIDKEVGLIDNTIIYEDIYHYGKLMTLNIKTKKPNDKVLTKYKSVVTSNHIDDSGNIVTQPVNQFGDYQLYTHLTKKGTFNFYIKNLIDNTKVKVASFKTTYDPNEYD